MVKLGADKVESRKTTYFTILTVLRLGACLKKLCVVCWCRKKKTKKEQSGVEEFDPALYAQVSG